RIKILEFDHLFNAISFRDKRRVNLNFAEKERLIYRMAILTAANAQRLCCRPDIMSDGPKIRLGCRVVLFGELT
ncbi:unnamed protein product, partial [marine sediment metagenome]